MKTLALGAVLVGLLGAVAGTFCRPELGDPRPSSGIVVSAPSHGYSDPWQVYEPTLSEIAYY